MSDVSQDVIVEHCGAYCTKLRDFISFADGTCYFFVEVNNLREFTVKSNSVRLGIAVCSGLT